MTSERHEDDDHDDVRYDLGRTADGPGPRRPARRPRAAVLAVAAAVLLAGGGGAYWAVASGGDGGHHTAAPLKLEGSYVPADSAGRLPGSDDSSSSSSSSATPGDPVVPGGDYVLTGTLPKDGPDSSAVYRPKSAPGKADVEHLAKLLGVTGEVTSADGWWRIGDRGPSLLVNQKLPGAWSYSRGGPQTFAPDQSKPVTEQRAKSAAAPLLDGLGLSGARTDAAQTIGAMRLVLANPVVGGLPTTGWSTSLEVGPDGSVSVAHGQLATLDKGDTYPVVSAAQAFKELDSTGRVMHPGDSTGVCVRPLPVPAPAPSNRAQPQAGPGATNEPGPQSTPNPGTTESAAGSGGVNGGVNGGVVPPTPAQPPSSTPPAPPQQGKTLPRPIPCLPGDQHPMQVRGAEFGLSAQFTEGGQTLVPAWLFQVAQPGAAATRTVAEPAVEPSFIEQPTPAPTVTPTPVDPGGPQQPGAPKTTGYEKLTAYRAGGDNTLTLTYYGGVCSTYKASAQETGAEVKVGVVGTVKNPGAMCPDLARSYSTTVHLKAPLGDRKVVDVSDGRPLKQAG